MYYHNNELPPQQGWICPNCGRVNAPWMPTCGCVSSQTSGTGTPYLVKTSSISRYSHEIADTPMTDAEITELAKEIVHKMIDNSDIAEDAYPDLRQRMHEAVERLDEYYPSEDERSE